jgi:T5orf172 domain
MGKFDGIPLTPIVVSEIIETVIQEKEMWRRRDLVNRVQQFHKDEGGIAGQQNIFALATKALRILQSDGKVETPVYGHWRWISNGQRIVSERISTELTEEPEADNLDDEDDLDEEQVTVAKTIGDGRESIYVYYNPNDKELAELKGKSIWECKIGRTGTADSVARILGQGVRTALSHQPIVGLVIKTDNSAALEKALHAALRMIDSEVPDSLGVEWFMTSPDLVEKWYQTFQQSLSVLKAGL